MTQYWTDERAPNLRIFGESPNNEGHALVMAAFQDNTDWPEFCQELIYATPEEMFNPNAPSEANYVPPGVVLQVTPDGRGRYQPELWYQWTVHELSHLACYHNWRDATEECADAEQEHRHVPIWWRNGVKNDHYNPPSLREIRSASTRPK